MANINPCPFCGSTKVSVESKAGKISYKTGVGVQTKTFSVRCNKCHARGPTISGNYRTTVRNEDCPEYENAIFKWNDRDGK